MKIGYSSFKILDMNVQPWELPHNAALCKYYYEPIETEDTLKGGTDEFSYAY
jgi:hypothetical protein